jgi:hypothetical protein
MYFSTSYGGTGASTHGIQVGSGSNAYSFEDYALQTLIAHGTGAGQLYYVAQQRTSAYDVATKKWTILHTRQFNNNSGGDITIRELGLTFQLVMSNSKYILFSRDLLAEAKVLTNGQSVTYKYTIEYIFPA